MIKPRLLPIVLTMALFATPAFATSGIGSGFGASEAAACADADASARKAAAAFLEAEQRAGVLVEGTRIYACQCQERSGAEDMPWSCRVEWLVSYAEAG